MKRRPAYQVQEFAHLTGVSIRTLHYYDEIRLLVPKARTAAGYRLYDNDDALRLQQILLRRELGMSLDEIRDSLDNPGFDQRRSLLEQKRKLQERRDETLAMIAAIDAALMALDTNTGDTMDIKQLFNGFDPSQYEAEVVQRWGDTDAYREAAKRTQRYTPEDWNQFAAEQAAIYGDAVAAMKSGKKPTDPEVMEIAERARLSIDRWFYPCSREMHCMLANGYESDSRFAENIDKHGAGLTPFLAAAIRANAARGKK